MIGPMSLGSSPALPPSMLDPSIVDATPWTTVPAAPAAATDVAVGATTATDVAAAGAATATDVAATSAVATTSTADAIIAGAAAVEEDALITGAAAAPVPGVDVVVDTGAAIVAIGAAAVLGGALLYKALSGDAPPADAPGPTPAPAPMQDPTTPPPVAAPSGPVSGPVNDPGHAPPVEDPNTGQQGPMQASGTRVKSPRYAVPTCDRITIHGTDEIVAYIYHQEEIPKSDWAEAIDDWQRSGDLDHGITELETSIANREDAQSRFGEESLSDLGTPTGATHRQRIEYERALLRAMKKGLGGQ